MNDFNGAGRHLLIIEDDESILDACQMLFESRGFAVTAKRSPATIEHDINDLHPDCLLMDVSLPPYDGCEICARVKRKCLLLPVILFSASDVSDQVLISCGADAFVPKPFSIKKILSTVERTLTQRTVDAG